MKKIITAAFIFVFMMVLNAYAENPKILISTSLGDMEAELYPDKAPVTVKNFLDYVNEKFYDGLIFHRVIKGFMVQGGGFDENMNQKKGKEPIINEADNGLLNERGTLAMARTNDPNSATSQFFINHRTNSFLNHKAKTQVGWGYAVFGKVTKGLDVLDSIASVKTQNIPPFEGLPVDKVIIKSIKVIK